MSGGHPDLHVLTHSFPPRRSSDLLTYHRDGNIFGVKAVGNASQAAPAASANDYGDEIVGTAQKKVEAIQDVPISVSAFSAKALDEQKIEGGRSEARRVGHECVSPCSSRG